MVLVRSGWIHTNFRSFALVVWHRLQQRNNPTRFTRKKTTKSKTKTPKEHHQNLESDKSSLFWGFLVCVFPVCSGFVFLKPYILYAVRLKSLVYKKVQNKLLTVIFGSREKEESKMYERKGGQAHPSLEYISWISGFDMPIWLDFGHGWIWLDMVGYTQNPIKSFCMSLYTNKYYLTYVFGSREKERSKMYESGGGGDRLTPPWNTFLG